MRIICTTALTTLIAAFGLTACSAGPETEAFGQSEQALVVAPALIATGSLSVPTDLAGLSDTLENGMSQSVFGGVGSGLAWAGGTTFLGVPDRGPNATSIPNGTLNDNTTSFISRFESLDLALVPQTTGLPFAVAPMLLNTTLLYSNTPLVYGATPGLPSAVPVVNSIDHFYFSGRSDNFGAGSSTDPTFARLDPEAIRVAPDGLSVFVADEYGPFVYQFDRITGERLRSYALPAHFAISNLSPLAATEISGNTSGRVTNKGMEGLAITPDGSTLVGLVQSPLLQDGGDGARTNRIVTIDVASGATHEYVYDNRIGTKAFNSSEIIALNDHQFLIDTRDGKGLGDGSAAVVKQLWAVDIAGAEDVANLSGQATLLTKAVPKQLFLDLVPVLNQNGIASTAIPAKIEGLAFGNDVTVGGVVTHTLYVANDNDFLPDVAGPNVWYVFGFTDDYLASLNLSYTPQSVANPPPVIADVAVSTPVLWPPSNKLQTVTVSYSAIDELPGTECSLSVSANEGSSADWVVVDPHTVQLRASRHGYGYGRVYSIPVSCVDRNGAVTVVTATVSVPHDMP